jgi:hypothetical protein
MPVIPNRETGMATPRLLRTMGPTGPYSSPTLGRSRRLLELLAHLTVMKTEKIRESSATALTLSLVDGVLSLSELCAQPQVSAQRIYDLRSQAQKELDGAHPRRGRAGIEPAVNVAISLRRISARNAVGRRHADRLTPNVNQRRSSRGSRLL